MGTAHWPTGDAVGTISLLDWTIADGAGGEGRSRACSILAAAPTKEAQTCALSKSPTNWKVGPGGCICIPGEMFRMLHTLADKCGSDKHTGATPYGGSQMAYSWPLYGKSVLDVSYTHCAIVDTLLRLTIPLIRISWC